MNRREFIGSDLAGIASANLVSWSATAAGEETLYVNVEAGADTNSGTKLSSLKTLVAAAKRVNEGRGKGPATIIVAEGIYALDQTVLFKPGRQFTKTDRLTIRAESLPDDPDWGPARMPVLIPVMPLSKTWMGRPDPFGGVANGIQVESSHVTIRGFKILGMPHYEFPAKGQIHRVYAIAREGDALEDLEVTQCLFAGDPVALPLHLGVLARGHGVVVDHCVFHRCKLTVVFWGAQGGTANGDAMRYCLAVDNYGCGLWTTQSGDDFEFRNNIISGSQYAWIREGGRRHYKIVNSIFAGNMHLVGSGAGPALNFQPLDPAMMDLSPSIPAIDGPVKIVRDESRRDFLHVAEGTFGSDLGAGLFTKKA